jgi:hypothetical protein
MVTYACIDLVFAFSGVALVLGVFSLASRGAELWVVRAWVVLYNLGGVHAIDERSVDGTAELNWAVEAVLSRRRVMLGVPCILLSDDGRCCRTGETHHWSQ